MPDTQAPEIAALAERIEAVLHDMIGRGATPSILVGRGRWEIATFLANALSTPLPIAPQETMRDAALEEAALAAEAEHTKNRPKGWRGFDLGIDYAVEVIRALKSQSYALGQSPLPATVERELVEALKDAKATIESLYQHGDFSNGNTDATGSIDEGSVLAAGMVGRTVAQIDKALATASQPVDGEARK